jgi:hypothetical integral membrane protein (TIGR02206 family)
LIVAAFSFLNGQNGVHIGISDGLQEVLMVAFFAKEFDGQAFQMFSPSHLVVLGLLVLICVLIVVFRDRISLRTSKGIRYGIWITLYVVEVSWHVWILSVGTWTIQQHLPLWVCSALIWLSPLVLIKKNQIAYEFMYFFGLAGALQALLTPDLGSYNFPHYRFFQVFITHGLLFITALYMTAVEKMRPTWRSLVRVLISMNIYWLLVVVNVLIGSNYLYTTGKLDTPSLLDVLGPYPWYLLVIEGIGIVLCCLLMLPFAFKKKNRSSCLTL